MSGTDGTEDLQSLLQTFRSRLRREDVGLRAPRARARSRAGNSPTEGMLAQRDIDTVLGWAARTFEKLETGAAAFRDKQLYDLGRLFRLTEDEFTQLYLGALKCKPPHALHQESDAGIPSLSAWQEVLDAQEQMAYVTNASWDLVAHNRAFRELFEGGVPPDNTMRWMVFSPEARRKVLLDWERSWAPPVLNHLRGAFIESPEDPVLGQLVRDVHNDPVARPIYQQIPTSYRYPDGDYRPLFHRKKGRGRVLMASAAPSADPRARVIFLNMKITDPLPNRSMRSDRTAGSGGIRTVPAAGRR
ncbi:MmyB family transcriptional regulator [Streptomyces sp. NBC_01361]|uniref:MmyB family transcriptional regulator n=1 Tax=Streptomyces sp. NBC_01361 TaxID=2903838 RepID=UPI002E2ED874|nr:hypothetical protein [Streptomyces sp. NBC_01361]